MLLTVDEPALIVYPLQMESATETQEERRLAQEDRLRYAKVLVEIGHLRRAEHEVAEILDENPEQMEALSLFTKIKHMRGQLSLAVACSVQLQSRLASSGQARMHLESMLRLAQDPAQGAGEFIALGQNQLVQKPTAYLELEEAFRLFVTRKPNEASSTCRHVAGRYHERDPEVYKLAVLAESWIYELIGNLQVATEILERLGRERGFETDTDRLQALVSLYEKAGTRVALDAELNILRYLESNTGGTDVLGRLSVLYRRLGDPATADEYEGRHLSAYLREKHRPTFGEVVETAAKHFIPLERLREIRFIDSKSPEPADAREAAVARALQGDLEGARNAFASGGDGFHALPPDASRRSERPLRDRLAPGPMEEGSRESHRRGFPGRVHPGAGSRDPGAGGPRRSGGSPALAPARDPLRAARGRSSPGTPVRGASLGAGGTRGRAIAGHRTCLFGRDVSLRGPGHRPDS